MKRMVSALFAAALFSCATAAHGQSITPGVCPEVNLIATINKVALRPVEARCEPLLVDLFCRSFAQESAFDANEAVRKAGCLDKYSHILPARESTYAYAYVAQRTATSPSPARDQLFKAIWSERVGSVRYVRMTHLLLDDTFERFAREVADMTPMERLVVDLRGNQGGSVESAMHIAALFAPRAGIVLATERSASSSKPFVTTKRGPLSNTPTMVLVDETTVSSGEVVAAMMHEAQPRYVRIMGRQTYGKASYAAPFFYATQTSIYVTVSFTGGEITIGRDRRRIEGRGVSPHYVLTRDFMAGGRASLTDATVMHALKYHGVFRP